MILVVLVRHSGWEPGAYEKQTLILQILHRILFWSA